MAKRTFEEIFNNNIYDCTEEFQAYLDFMKEEYNTNLIYLDTLNFLQQDSRTFQKTVTRGTLEKKIKAYEFLFPMFK